MRYIFQNFEFDSTSLVLKKDNQALAIRHNEAKVLKLLLEHSDNVLVKKKFYFMFGKTKLYQSRLFFKVLVT